MPRMNPFAPPALNGLAGDYPNGYIDVSFDYPYSVALTANQSLRDQVVALDTDADFVWRAVIANASTGAYQIRFSDSQGYYLSNGMIPNNALLYGTVPLPYPIFPEIVLPAGGRIGIDITDLSGSGNTVQLLFRGVKRYRRPQ